MKGNGIKKDEAPIVVEQNFDRSVSDVWNAITDVGEMRGWFFDNIPDFKAEVGFRTQFLVESTDRSLLHLWEVTEVILCGGTMRVIADITDPDIIQKILDHIAAQPPPLKTAATSQS
jgi:hypothetical protein